MVSKLDKMYTHTHSHTHTHSLVLEEGHRAFFRREWLLVQWSLHPGGYSYFLREGLTWSSQNWIHSKGCHQSEIQNFQERLDLPALGEQSDSRQPLGGSHVFLLNKAWYADTRFNGCPATPPHTVPRVRQNGATLARHCWKTVSRIRQSSNRGWWCIVAWTEAEVLIPSQFRRPVAGCCMQCLVSHHPRMVYNHSPFWWRLWKGISDTHLNIWPWSSCGQESGLDKADR